VEDFIQLRQNYFPSIPPCFVINNFVLLCTMMFKTIFIISLLTIAITAPVVDATVCKDCNDAAPFLDVSQRLADGNDHSAAPQSQLLSDTSCSPSQKTDAAQDLCPVCSHSAAATTMLACGIPSAISVTDNHPKLLSISDP
jgi:hypothetical protein